MNKKLIIIGLMATLAGSLFAQDRPPRGERPDPAEFAAKMLADFDKDGSGSLDATELTEALAFQRENRPQRPQREGMGGKRPHAPNPDVVAGKMIENFDADDNGNLSEEELSKALRNMRRGGPKGKSRGPDAG